MSDSFMVATRLPMTREGFERWLDLPVPEGVVANPEAMFDGWFWDGSKVDERELDVAEVTPRSFFAEWARDSCSGGGPAILRHRDGALEAYLLDFGYDEWSVRVALLLFAAAGTVKTGEAEDVVLFWAETSGALGDADWDGRLAVLLVGKEGSRFTGPVDLTAAVAGLGPAQDAFYDLIERLGDDEESWDEGSGEPFHSATPLSPEFLDPAILADPS